MSELQSPELFDGPGGGSWSGGFGTDDAGRIIWLHGEFDDHAWRRAAACRDLDPGLFFPVGFTGAAAQQIAEAKAVCRGCPVRLACLQFALVSNQECGVWGGYDGCCVGSGASSAGPCRCPGPRRPTRPEPSARHR